MDLEKPAKQTRRHLREDAISKQEDVIQEHEAITLSQEDWEVFLEALENPPHPNTQLIKAFSEHEKRVVHEE